MIAHQIRDFLDALRDGARDCEAKLMGNAREGHSVIAGILILVHIFNYGIRSIGLDHFDELLLLKVLIGRPHVEYGTRDLLRGRTEDELNGSRGIAHMHVWPPELLTVYLKLLLGQHLHGEFVYR